MERPNQQIWISRLLALLIISVFFATLLTHTIKKVATFDYKITVRANETEIIVKAIENLGISDIDITTKKTSRFTKYPNVLFYNTLSISCSFGMLLGLYYAAYCLVNAILFRPKKDKSILTQP